MSKLQTALDCGGVVNLFSLLKDWSRDDLKALLSEADEYAKKRHEEIDTIYQRHAFVPNVFFSRAASRTLDSVANNARWEVDSVMAEIRSVALFYLEPEEDAEPREVRS